MKERRSAFVGRFLLNYVRIWNIIVVGSDARREEKIWRRKKLVLSLHRLVMITQQ